MDNIASSFERQMLTKYVETILGVKTTSIRKRFMESNSILNGLIEHIEK